MERNYPFASDPLEVKRRRCRKSHSKFIHMRPPRRVELDAVHARLMYLLPPNLRKDSKSLLSTYSRLGCLTSAPWSAGARQGPACACVMILTWKEKLKIVTQDSAYEEVYPIGRNAAERFVSGLLKRFDRIVTCFDPVWS